MVNNHNLALIIDDSATIRSLLADMLSKNGFQALSAETMELALQDAGRKNFDIAIVDIFMPGMGGIEGISKIREISPNAKIIAISAGHGDMEKDMALKAAVIQGADATLAKPFEEEALMAAINALLNNEEADIEDASAA
ncbi:MAG: response regulator [Rhodospirillales bacterium]|nr:response regulator [Rhodospirillales bacterium]